MKKTSLKAFYILLCSGLLMTTAEATNIHVTYVEDERCYPVVKLVKDYLHGAGIGISPKDAVGTIGICMASKSSTYIGDRMPVLNSGLPSLAILVSDTNAIKIVSGACDSALCVPTHDSAQKAARRAGASHSVFIETPLDPALFVPQEEIEVYRQKVVVPNAMNWLNKLETGLRWFLGTCVPQPKDSKDFANSPEAIQRSQNQTLLTENPDYLLVFLRWNEEAPYANALSGASTSRSATASGDDTSFEEDYLLDRGK